MIDPKLDAQEKLPEARRMYEHAEDHHSDSKAEMHRCARNYHNTGGNGQWDEDDRQYLEDEQRPALTFNLIKRYVDTSIGMHMDMQRKAVARPVGSEDRFLSDVLEAICDRVDDMACSDAVDATVLKDGYIKGIGNGHLDVVPDPKHPGWVKVKQYPASPYDVLWDPASEATDHSDASHVFYARWLSKTEFKIEYPEHADEWDALSESESGEPTWLSSGEPQGVSEGFGRIDDYNRAVLYFDKYKQRVRVIHLEYVIPRKQAHASINGQTVAVTADEMDAMRRFGDVFSGVQFSYTWTEDVHALEFVGTRVLYDSTESDAPYQPYDGLSIEPFAYAKDSEKNVPYGPIRNAIDPQGRVNKAFSIMLEHLIGQHKPGYVHEKSAISDIDAFETALAQDGTSAEVEDGALTGGKIAPRPMPQPSAAAQQQIEVSTEMLERVFGLGNDLIQPAAQQEAATTVAIRYHKSQLALADVRRSYDLYQRGIKRRKIEVITRAMPDDQIAALLGNDQKYRVQGGVVMEVAPGPQGQPMVVQQASLRDLRNMEFNIEFESTTGNNTLRMLELQSYMEAATRGIPVDPMMIVDKMAESRADREQLRAYVKQTQQQQAQMQQLQMQQLQAAVGTQLQIEAGKVQETSRHNQAEERIQIEKNAADMAAKFAAVIEKADANEKRSVVEQYKAQQQRMAGLEQASIRASGPSGPQ